MYIYTYHIWQIVARLPCPPSGRQRRRSWLWTNGDNTYGAAAKVMNFDRLGKKVRPGTFGKIKAG